MNENDNRSSLSGNSLKPLEPAGEAVQTVYQATPQSVVIPPAAPQEVVAPTAAAAPQPQPAAPATVVPNITIVNNNTQNAGAVVVLREKSMLVALALTFFFGPLGMLYSTIPGAIVTFILNLIIGIPTAGLGLFLTWPIQMIWTYMAVRNHNSRQLRRVA